MIRVYIFAEGQTEETFIRDVLVPHYARQSIFLVVILARTSPGHKGGVVSYGKVKYQLERICKQHHSAWVTTMIDLYNLPKDFPGRSDQDYPKNGRAGQKAIYLEQKFANDINQPKFIPNLMVHEYEALLFCQPDKFGEWIDNDAQAISRLQADRDSVETPEEINDDPNTAPSKRIKAIMPQYQKTLHGPLIAGDIGLDEMRRQCPHFDHWLHKIEQLKV